LRAALVLGRDELSLYDRVHGLLKRDLRPPDLLVCLQARPDVLEERVRRAGQAPYPRDHLERSAATYAEYFFHYQESPLLVVNTSEIDFIARKSDLDALVAVIHKTRSGVHHLNPLGSR
jgi:deoxyadenosine/deoxycytidine kinase